MHWRVGHVTALAGITDFTLLWNCHRPPCNQGPWSTPLSTRPASKRRHSLEQPTKPFFGTAIQPLRPPPPSPCPAKPVWKPPIPCHSLKQPTNLPLFATPPNPLLQRPAPVGTPPPHRASFKKRHFSSFCTRNVKNTTYLLAPPTKPHPRLPPPSTRPAPVGTPTHPTGILQKTQFF